MVGLDVVKTVAIEIDYQPISDSLVYTLSSVRVQQRLGAPSLCELVFDEPPATTPIEIGQSIGLRCHDGEARLFTGHVTAQEHLYEPDRGHRLRIRAYDTLHLLRKRQPAVRRVGLRAADLARELTSDLALKVEARVAGPLLDDLVQHDDDDLALLVRVCARAGLYPTVRGDTLYLVTLEGMGEPLPLTLNKDLLEASFTQNAEHAIQSVAATCWNPKTAESFASEVLLARSGREIEANTDAAFWTVDGSRVLTGTLGTSGDESEALAQAELDRRSADEVRFAGVTVGRPELSPASIVEVRGVAAALAGHYVLTAVDHLFDGERGYVCELGTAAPAHPPSAPSRAAVALGVVTRVDDPEDLARVRVLFESHGGVESDWLSVVVPGAGEGRGMISLPDVDDRVVILLPDGDPAKGVVLGGLFGPTAPEDAGVSGGATRRFTWSSGGGERIRIDDETEEIRAETRHGKRLVLGPEEALLENDEGSRLLIGDERVELIAARDLVVAAPGREITIRANRIRFERG